MIECSRGDVVLVNFIFSDESGVKRRPAVVISSNEYNRSRNEAIVAAITSQINRLLIGDYLIADWGKAGLLFPSVATGIIRTVKHTMIDRKIGAMPVTEMEIINSKLRVVLNLKNQ
jgi:mRNA interferase MazF